MTTMIPRILRLAIIINLHFLDLFITITLLHLITDEVSQNRTPNCTQKSMVFLMSQIIPRRAAQDSSAEAALAFFFTSSSTSGGRIIIVGAGLLFGLRG